MFALDTGNKALLKYTRNGQGYPLILQHGYLGGAKMWQAQIDHFKSGYDVIAPNLAGFGDSSELIAPESIPESAQQVFDLLDSLGVERFYLLGHSMGGMVVQQMATMQKERIEKLVCYGTGPLGVLPGRFETLDQTRARLKADGLAATAKRIAATWFVEGKNAPGFPTCEAEAKKATMQAELASLTAWEKWDLSDVLATIRCPTLVLWGDRDQSYAWQQPQSLWQGISDSYLAVVPGCGHNVHMEKPALFNMIVDDFLSD